MKLSQNDSILVDYKIIKQVFMVHFSPKTPSENHTLAANLKECFLKHIGYYCDYTVSTHNNIL